MFFFKLLILATGGYEDVFLKQYLKVFNKYFLVDLSAKTGIFFLFFKKKFLN